MQISSLSISPLVASIAMAFSGTVWAQASPYSLSVSQGFSRDSNLFGVDDAAAAVSDTVSTTSLLAGIDQPFGRQRFYANGSVRYNKYQDTSALDNTGYGLTTGLDWSTIEQLSGTLRYNLNTSLADYASPDAPQITTRNEQKSQQLGATVRYGITARVALEGGLEHRKVDFSDAQDARGYSQNVANAGVKYGVSGLLTVGAGLRITKGDTPVTGDKLDRNDIDLTAAWSPTGLSTLNARLSFSKENHSDPARADFSGATGSIAWAYKPTGKLNFNTSLTRDTGSETTFRGLTPEGAPLVFDTSRLTTTAALSVGYELTGKIQLSGDARRSNGSFGNGGSDKATNLSFGARYLPTRAITLACNLSRDSRDISGTSQRNVTANTAGCSAQLTLQ